MPGLWTASSPDGWNLTPLTRAAVVLEAHAQGVVVRAGATGRPRPGDIQLRRGSEPVERWLLLASPRTSVWVNGDPLRTGLQLLRDRDQIVLSGAAEAAYFTTEMLAAVVSFPGAERPLSCPRCRQVIPPGAAAVQCPRDGCRLWYHQACWLYAETCAMCPQETALDTGYVWSPDAVEKGVA